VECSATPMVLASLPNEPGQAASAREPVLLFTQESCAPNELPCDARAEASYLSQRKVKRPTRIERDDGLVSRGVGKSPLIPKEVKEEAGRAHLAAANRFNPALGFTETLDQLLNAIARANAPEESEEGANGAGGEGAGGADVGAAAVSLSSLEQPVPLSLNLEEKVLPDGWTPLMHACRSGKVADVRTLLGLGANPNTRDRHGNSPLHKAAVAGACDKLRMLIEHGADMECSNRYGRTPLHEAAHVGWHEACALLVRLGARHDARDGPLLDGLTPSQVAQEAGWVDVCEALKANERRRVRLAAGDTCLYSAAFPAVAPLPFSPMRMSVQAVWGRDSKHGTWGMPSVPRKFVSRETRYW